MLLAILVALTASVATPRPAADTACQVLRPDPVPVQGRKSPLDSLTFEVGTHPVKVCYGRPSLRGRKMIGGEAVPYGKLWRTGANEPTIFYTPIAVTVAGLRVGPGAYSLYTVPGADQWVVIVNRSISQWGEEHNYTHAVQAQEVGRGKVKSETVTQPIETFTMRAEPAPGGVALLVLEWDKTRIRIPFKPA